ncbi:MAG TPA: cobalamin biosynthesis protein [Pseudonocardia sp.]
MTQPDLVVGIGCRPGVAEHAVRQLLAEVLGRHGCEPAAVRGYATLQARAREPALLAVCGGRLLGFPASVLAEVTVPNPSSSVAASVGTPSVAEAAALHAARVLAPPGATAALIGVKAVGSGVTVALARIEVATTL